MIDIRNLTKDFGRVVAVRDLTLHVPDGEIFCFLGPNGAGKTTTIKMLTGLLRPTAGHGLIDGIDIHEHPVEAKRRIGYIPDMPFLYEHLTPDDFMTFIADLYEIPRTRLHSERESLFDLFHIHDFRHALIRDLSHGMRQRVIYAATLLHKPSVLFIDEPLIGLDPYTIRLIKNLLRRQAQAGMTVFLTTHILALAEDIADRIGIILHGRLTTLGTLDELRARYNRRTLEDIFLERTASQEPLP